MSTFRSSSGPAGCGAWRVRVRKSSRFNLWVIRSCLATLVALCTSLLLSCGCPPIRNPSSKFDHPSSFVHVFVFVFSVFFVICLRPTALGLAWQRMLGHTGGPLHIFVVVLWLPPYPKPI